MSLEEFLTKQQEEIKNLRENVCHLIQNPSLLNSHPENDFEILKTLLTSDEWPIAVNPNLICNLNSEQDKLQRADTILDILINTPIEMNKFLDFGCGEGHVVKQVAKHKPRLAIGYDINYHTNWENYIKEPIQFTNDFSVIQENGPYNIILFYDVIDHLQTESEIIEVLKQAFSVLDSKGKIYLRCHPWCSRHGTHAFRSINKAFIHLIFTEEELNSLGYNGLQTIRILHPANVYEKIFKEINIKIISKSIDVSEPLDAFFKNVPVVANRIMKLWPGNLFPEHIRHQFIDYILMR